MQYTLIYRKHSTRCRTICYSLKLKCAASLALYSLGLKAISPEDSKGSSWMAPSRTGPPVTSGVPQGSILGPIMFLIYINDAPDYICSSSIIALFADNSKLYRAITQPRCGNNLQKDLNGLHKWSQDWSMDFNEIKCKVMHISKKKISSATNRSYTLDDRELESVLYITDLGIIVSNNMSWNRHIEETVCEGQQDPWSTQKSLQRDTWPQLQETAILCTSTTQARIW